MRKQPFGRVKKTVCILLAVLFLASLTAASASAWYNKKGEIIAPPEKPEVETPKETKVAPAPAPVVAPAPSSLSCAGGFGECAEFGACCGFCNCCKCNDEKKIAIITAVRVIFAKGEGCFDRALW